MNSKTEQKEKTRGKQEMKKQQEKTTKQKMKKNKTKIKRRKKRKTQQKKAKSHGSWTRYSNQVASSQPDYMQQPAYGGVFLYGWSGEGMDEKRKMHDAENPQPPAAGHS